MSAFSTVLSSSVTCSYGILWIECPTTCFVTQKNLVWSSTTAKFIVCVLQEMLECRDKLRCDPPDNYTYHDRLFANRINHLIQLTDASYHDTMYREALKTGFYDLQVSNK